MNNTTSVMQVNHVGFLFKYKKRVPLKAACKTLKDKHVQSTMKNILYNKDQDELGQKQQPPVCPAR